MAAGENGGGLLHGFPREAVAHRPGIAAPQGRDHCVRQQVIAVRLARGTETGVKVGCGFGRGENPDRARQQGVQPRPDPRGRNRGGRVEMSYLSFGVHPGVGPPGPDHGCPLPRGLSVEPPDGCFDPSLDSVAVRLRLPAGEVGPVIGEIQTHADRQTHDVCLRGETSGRGCAYSLGDGRKFGLGASCR